MSFLTQIQAYIGIFSDTTSLDTWLTQGAKNIINMLPEDIVKQYALDLPVTNSGLSTSGYKVYRIHYNGYGSMEYPIDMKARLQDTNSMYYATPTSPAHIYDNALLFIFPNGGTILAIKYPTVVNTDVAITDFPPELVQGVILYASIQGLLENISNGIISLGAITFSSQTAPTTPTAPSFTYNAAVIGTIASTTIGSLGTAPTYTAPAYSGSQTNVSTQLSNADFELAQGYLSQINEQLTQYSADMNNNYHTFESANVAYQANLQVVIQQAQLDQQRLIETARMTTEVNVQNAAKNLEQQISQYSATLQKYSADLTLYRANVEQEVRRVSFLVQQLGQKLPLWSSNLALLKNEYNEILKSNGIQ